MDVDVQFACSFFFLPEGFSFVMKVSVFFFFNGVECTAQELLDRCGSHFIGAGYKPERGPLSHRFLFVANTKDLV